MTPMESRMAWRRFSRSVRRGALAAGLAAVVAAPAAAGDGSRLIGTHLYELKVAEAALGPGRAKGGAIAPLGDDLLVVRTGAGVAVIRSDRSIDFLDGAIPMNRDAYLEHDLFEDPHKKYHFRVADALVQPLSPGEWALFVSHHYFTGSCVRFRVSRTVLRRDGDGEYALAAPWTVLFDAEPCLAAPFSGLQAGGKMLTDDAGRLLIVIGDHARDGWSHSDADGYLPALPQTADSHMGKLVRLDMETGDAEILAVGLRNPQGLTRDADGGLWATEHGPNGGDELNYLEFGQNYGWPLVTLGRLYNAEMFGGGAPPTADPETVGLHDGFASPVFSWVPSIGVGAILVNEGRHFPLWRDDLLIASLDGRSVFRARRDDGRVQYVERIDIGERIRDMAWRADGKLALFIEKEKNFVSSVLLLSRSDRWCVESLRGGSHAWALHCDEEARRRSEVAWREGLEVTLSREPSIRSEFDVWLTGNRLIWFREECAPEDVAADFFLRVVPENRGDLLEKWGRYGYEDRGFAFAELPPPPPAPDRRYAGLVDGACVASVHLPGYDILRIQIGQTVDTGADEPSFVWQGEIFTKREEWLDLYESVASRKPLVRSDFDIYIDNGNLVYVGEAPDAEDAMWAIFLHVYPADDAALPEERREHGFDNLDFGFHPSACAAAAYSPDIRAAHLDGKCVIVAPLPTYAIRSINTGLIFRDDEGRWQQQWAVEIDAPDAG